MLLVFFGLLAVTAFSQRKITGKVTAGETGSGLPGASVKVKGAAGGVSTGADGSYAIDVPANATLVVSFVGYESKDVKVGAESVLNVVLQASNSALQSVVVTGYASQERRNITGSVAVVDTRDMMKYAAARTRSATRSSRRRGPSAARRRSRRGRVSSWSG